MKLIKLLFISLLGVILTACGGGDGSGLPSQGGDGDASGPTIVSLQVTPATAAVPVGFDQQFTAIATLSDGTTRDVTNDQSLTWTSSDVTLATLISGQADGNGLATGVAPGTVTITAAGTSNGTAFSATAKLEVTNAVVTALQVTPATAAVPVGFEQQYTAMALLSDGRTLDVTNQRALSWSSSDTATAVIENTAEQKGIATGVVPGKVTITAAGTVNGTTFSATAQLEVTNAVVTALQVTPATASVPVGFEQQFTAVAILSDGRTLDVTHQNALSWSSSNTATAVIENARAKKGIAKGLAKGVVTITAAGTANGTAFTATAQLAVTNAVLTALQVTPATDTVPAGLEQQFTATAIFSDDSTRDVTNDAALSWTSSNTGIATIASNQTDGNGLATGVVPGTVTITASGTANGSTFSATAQLEVTNPVVTTLKVRPSLATVPVGFEQQFTAIATLSDGQSLDVTDQTALHWSSSNTSAVVIQDARAKKGIATALDQNTVDITASIVINGSTINAQAVMRVVNPVVTALTVTPATASVPAGLQQQFTATAMFSDGSTRDVTNDAALNWTSNDPGIATIASSQVNGNGLATGIVPGTVTITAAGIANETEFSGSAQFVVTDAIVTSLEVTPPTATVPAGLKQQFTATATLSNGQPLNVTNDDALSWSSSDTNIATIASDQPDGNGLATGSVPGSVTITASGSANGSPFSDSVQLEVTNAVVTALQVTPKSATVPVDQTQQFTATATMSDGSSLDVTQESGLNWVSSDEAKATITTALTAGNGIATGQEAGIATITASGIINDTPLSDSAALTVAPCGPLMVGNKRFTCPPTVAEATTIGAEFTEGVIQGGVEWAQFDWIQADAYCTKIGLRLPTGDELANLYATYPDDQPGLTYHWPTKKDENGALFIYWGSEKTGSDTHVGIQLAVGRVIDVADDQFSLRVPSCVAEMQP